MYANNTKAQIDYVLINNKWKNSALNCEAYSSFEGVSTDHRIVTAKIRLSLRKNAKRTATTKHYDWALLNNKDIRDKYVLELRNRFETLQEKTEKSKVRSPDGDTEYFDIVAGVLQGDTLALYLFIICLDYVLRTSIDKIKENGFELTKKRSRIYPATTITDADYADDIAILVNTPDQAETLLHSLERAAASIGLYVNAHKTEYMCYNQTGDISTLEGTPLKLVDKFTYLGSSVESTEKDIETRLTKAWTAINRLSIIWKSGLTDKMKRSFFQAAVTSILLYGCTTWTLTKRLEKKLDGNYTRMLRAILNKSWQQHPTRHQLYGHLPPITKTIQVRRTRHAGHCWRSRDELIRDVLLWIPTHGRAKAKRPARTYIQQLCEDTGCCPEDLPRAMNDRED